MADDDRAHEHAHDHDHDYHGANQPFADDAARLLGVVQDWARQNFPAGRDGHMGPECQWCPLCQFMAVVRGDRPDVTARVAEAGAALAAAFRSLVDAANAPRTEPAEPPESAGPAEPGRVQHIDLDDPE